MKLSQFKFKLPEDRIAQYPVEHRDESRLMVVHKKSDAIEHVLFKDILNYFDEKDVFRRRQVPALRFSCCVSCVRRIFCGTFRWILPARSVSETNSTLVRTTQWWLR